MEQGQAATQPEVTVDSIAQNLSQGILRELNEADGIVEKPRDEKGKFTKAETEAAATETEPEKTEETEQPAEETTETEQSEPDWETLKTLKRKLTVKAEDNTDQDVEVTLEEMEKGYIMEKSYRQKTAELARKREAMQAEIKNAIDPRIKEYDEKLQQAEQVIWHTLAPEIQKTDWNALARDNPAEWAQRSQLRQNVEAQLAHIKSERQKIAEAQQKEIEVNLKKQAAEAVETLKAEIPGWSDEKYGAILKAGIKEYGFKAEEVNAITDPRAIKVLHDAMKYREASAKPVTEKRVAAKVPTVIKPGTSQKTDPSADKFKDGMAQLRKTGHTNEAVAVAKLLLDREAKQQK